MSIPKSQHYVPQFIIRQWANQRGEVKVWKRLASGEVISRWTSPKNVMCSSSLYNLQFVPTKEIYSVEHEFRRVENDASRVYRKILNRQLNISRLEREIWAVFILAQIARIPRHIRGAEARAKEYLEIWAQPDAEFDRTKGDLPYAALIDYFNKERPSIPANMHLRTILNIISQPDLIERICSLDWSVRWNISVPILLGDEPAIYLGSLKDGPCELFIPLSPNFVFYATDEQHRGERFQNTAAKKLAHTLNTFSVKAANYEVIGNAEPRFIAKHL